MSTFDHFQQQRTSRSGRVAAVLVVLALHLLLLLFLAFQRGVVISPPMPPIHLSLMPPFGGGGGGQPAERADEASAPPLALNRPPNPQPRPDSPPLTAEATPAPHAPLIAAAQPAESVETVSAQGGAGAGSGSGIGTGSGSGVGSGSGDGVGAGAGPGVGHQLIQGPADAVVSAGVSMAQVSVGAYRYAVLQCRIGLNQRLQGCRVVREYPVGDGAGREAMQKSREFRIRPPSRNGVYLDRQPVTVAISLPPRADRRRGRGVDVP